MTRGRDALDPALLRLIGVILLGGMLGILNSTMAAVATGTLAAEFSAPLSTIGWVSTGFLLAVTAAIPFTTWAVDRYGGRRLWLAGLGLFLAGSLGSGLAWDTGPLIAFRIVQGLGTGILDPLVLVLLARAAGPARAGRVMGLMGVVLSLGPVLGPVAGGLILSGLDWRWMFLLNVPLGLVAVLLALRVLPADAPGNGDGGAEGPRLDVLGLALLGPGFGVLVLAMTQSAERDAFAVWPVLAPLAAGAALLGWYGLHASRPRRDRSRPPLIDLRLFTSVGFSASVATMTLVGLATYAALFALPLYYQQAHGHGVLAAGLLLAPFGAGSAVAMPLAGRLSDRIGSRGLALGGAVAALLAALALTRVGAGTGEAWPAVASLVLGLGLGFVGAPTMGSMYRTLPPPLVPQGSSVLYMLNQLGASVGIAVVTLILQAAGPGEVLDGVRGVFWFGAGATAAILAAGSLLPGRPAPASGDVPGPVRRASTTSR
ncbi:DHA2 family efflux MFS transporter permease subunit [Actinomadura rugatobispora]|uniref:DHA2 family efflux MFS transporter permease subunit n=1 Tax=Actinomadura rugatobispora TaxID=1994 RepID=A0ABW1A887_9ACTN|nr:MDR family MFS transporter [Actinomadura rugatobispora]